LVDEPTESEARASAPAVVVPDISIEGLSLIDPEADAIDGAVLVLAGIGGPDAVRKLLAALPTSPSRARATAPGRRPLRQPGQAAGARVAVAG
jgi:chemosensory pili system protein ChpB (putative protein-glutamate methylesterase)